MGEDDDPRSSKGSFSSIWQRGKEKVGIGSGKSVTFVPDVSPGGGNGNEQGGIEADNLTPKQRRRAQVRKAQIEHRQRKENYVKHLEQDVIDLREMIATATTQAVIFKHENAAIKAALSNAQLSKVPVSSPPTTAPLAPSALPQASQLYEPLDFSSFNQDYEVGLTGPQPEAQSWSANFASSDSSRSSSLVSTCFDEFIDSACLQISPTMGQDIFMTEAPNFSKGLPTNFTTPSKTPSTDIINIPSADEQLSNVGEITIPEADLATIAINFILALEHPCRTHFQAPASAFAPNGPPGGHELMASTFVYSTAPDTIFSSPTFKEPFPSPPAGHKATQQSLSPASIPIQHSGHTHSPELTWTTTTPLALSELHAMASSLPKNDWEITPVQAWFKLVERYPAHTLLSNQPGKQTVVLDSLKRGLGAIVGCFAFGAVMDEARFWDVVEGVLGNGSGPGSLVV